MDVPRPACGSRDAVSSCSNGEIGGTERNHCRNVTDVHVERGRHSHAIRFVGRRSRRAADRGVDNTGRRMRQRYVLVCGAIAARGRAVSLARPVQNSRQYRSPVPNEVPRTRCHAFDAALTRHLEGAHFFRKKPPTGGGFRLQISSSSRSLGSVRQKKPKNLPSLGGLGGLISSIRDHGKGTKNPLR